MEGMIYGVHPVLEALESGQEVDRIFVMRGRQDSVNPVLEAAKARGIHVKFVPVEKLQRLTKKNHQGVIAFLSAVSFAELDHVVGDCYERGETPLIVVLDRVTDVRNVGAIARSAECCGAHALVIPEQQSAPMNADAVKSSAGALLRLPICRVKNLSHALADLENSGLSIVGCTEKGDSSSPKRILRFQSPWSWGPKRTAFPRRLERLPNACQNPHRRRIGLLKRFRGCRHGPVRGAAAEGVKG